MNLKQDLDHHHHPHPHQQQQLSDHSSDHLPHSNRRPRGFAVAASSSGDSPTAASGGLGKGPRREREKEKERTKLRERHRRAITSRMLAGLRQYGNFPLPARADMNDVLASLAREAGWIVEPDGTTYRSTPLTSAPPPQPPLPQLAPFKAALDSQSSLLRIERSLSPVSLDSIVVAERDLKAEKFASERSPIESPECIEADELMRGGEECNGNFGGTTYIPFYVMLPVGIVNNYCQLVDPEALRQELRHLTALHVDGVVVTCWWGIIEGWSPQKYQWSGYRDVFNIIREFKLKFQAVMAFHEHGGNVSGDPIPLPKWILEIGKDNQDIFFTDREGRRNTECLSWGIDKERVLKGRTGIEVCFDFMRSFRIEFHDFFEEGLVSAIEIGFGASGELKYPSFPERMGWRYPGIGEFQCYDRYLQQNLRRAAKLSGHSYWARGPDNAGYYNSRPYETGFFCDHGDYDSYYGRFFLRWYSQILIDHVDLVLSLAKLAFEGTQLVVKIPSVYWWYKTCSHPAELTAGFYNPTNRDGYSPVFEMLKKHSVTMKFICFGSQASNLDVDDALADPDGLSWQVLNSAWDLSLPVASQSAVSCHDREAIIKVLEIAKPRNDPDHHHLSFFTFQPPSPIFMQGNVFLSEVDNFIKCMHGELSGDIEA